VVQATDGVNVAQRSIGVEARGSVAALAPVDAAGQTEGHREQTG